MKVKHWVLIGSIAGVGVASYFVLRKPRVKVLDIRHGEDGIVFSLKVGKREIDILSSKKVVKEEMFEYPLFTYTFKTNPEKTFKGVPALELKIKNRIGGGTETFNIEKQGKVV